MTEHELQKLLNSLSLEEKAFQLSQVPGPFYVKDAQIAGTEVENDLTDLELAMMGSTLYVYGPDEMHAVQEKCIADHPHHIPMMFMMDVIHGYRTVFPIPLAMGASFDPDGAETMMQVSAAESSSEGIHVAFSPMLDLVRDPRWGRVMESTGEDPYLNSVLGQAMVRGLQGDGRVSSCIKHYAAYGAPEGGRDYQNSELSEHTLREYYLPAYRAAVEAGADMVMSSFQTLNGLPSAANPWLLKDILRGEWGFKGVIITDWAAIAEMVKHGICADLKEAALTAFLAGVDIDMCSMAYHRYLPELVREGKISEADLDRSVLRVLTLKNKLGLFENPYKDANKETAKELILCAEHRSAARKAVSETLVLLKNSKNSAAVSNDTLLSQKNSSNNASDALLPLKKDRSIALIGPYVNCEELYSAWAPNGRNEDTVTVQAAAEELEQEGYKLTYSRGCRLETRADLLAKSRESSILQLRCGTFPDAAPDESELAKKADAIQAAWEADTVVLFLGEHRSVSGEGASRANITLPENQLDLLRSIYEVNQNIVTVVFSGRPLDLREVCRFSKSVVMAWLPGTEGGHGIMDVLTGKENFSGRLPMSIPVSVGQIPVFYNQLSTGRPKDPVKDDPNYCSAYLDTPNRPLFPFGYGLSYSRFSISQVQLSANEVENCREDLLQACAEVLNTSDRAGVLTVQLYIRDDTASLARPVKELKGFQRISLAPGEKKTVKFNITPAMLSYTGKDNKRIVEPGTFTVWIGEDSETQNQAAFTLK
ncbi:MAG: glycoside hydrolase family 3 C-terminal domain-containing protein [Lachnospiraceae bacterium]|nr:glycoside hydrolase family 3 C-terminal domain-containing protein [Lachnospiraceae bacterium]